MATKYILLSKQTNKPIDKRPYTLDQLKEKVYAIKKEQSLTDEQMNETYGYLEIDADDGGVSAEQNTSAPTQSGDDEFKSTENNDSKYAFSSPNDIQSPVMDDSMGGWNKLVDDMKFADDDVAQLVAKSKDHLKMEEGKTGNLAMKKNAIRVLYLYNEFLRFYDTYCGPEGEFPDALSAYFCSRGQHLGLNHTQDEEAFDVIKRDMKNCIEQMFDEFEEYYEEGGHREDAMQEFYDEIADFDDEIKNIHTSINELGSNCERNNRFAAALAQDDAEFNNYCGGQPSAEKMSKYIMDIAVNKYHLSRIKMNSNDPNSTPEWFSPESQASTNVRLHDDVNDYLELKDANVLNFKQTKILDEKNAQELDKIKKEFQSGKMTQQQAQSEINKLVSLSRAKLRTSLKLFFEFMGIKDTNIMNKFASGLGRLDEGEYNEKWLSLVEHYKEAMDNKIKMYTKAHSGDMSDENLNLCVEELNGLLKVAAAMEKDIKEKKGEQLLRDVQQISDCLAKVKKMTADAKNSFAKQ